jgi:hypothetical protein
MCSDIEGHKSACTRLLIDRDNLSAEAVAKPTTTRPDTIPLNRRDPGQITRTRI